MIFLAKRFVAGVTREEALERAREARKQGFLVTLDHLGEHIKDSEEARLVAAEYVALLGSAYSGLNGSAAPDASGVEPVNLSVKPTHLGLDISQEEVLRNLRLIARVAQACKSFVRLDMEGSPYTQATVELAKELNREFPGSAGVVIQAYLYRSHEDIENLIHEKIRVRLCKGAYREPSSIALTDRGQVNSSYDKLAVLLMEHGTYPAFATHDEDRIKHVISLSRQMGKESKDFEFQMLLGVRAKLARELLKSGFRVRLYLPYGKDWFAYFYRRIRERKENLTFALTSIFRD